MKRFTVSFPDEVFDKLNKIVEEKKLFGNTKKSYALIELVKEYRLYNGKNINGGDK